MADFTYSYQRTYGAGGTIHALSGGTIPLSFTFSELNDYYISSVNCTLPITVNAKNPSIYKYTVKYNVKGSSSIEYTGSNTTNATISVNSKGVTGGTGSVEMAALGYSGSIQLGTPLTATFSLVRDFTIEPIFPLDTDQLAISVPNTFTWTNTMIGDALFPVTSQKLYWKYANDLTYNVVQVSATDTSYTFPLGTFENGSIQWYLNATDSAGHSVNSAVQTVEIGVIPSVRISYPNGVNVRNSNIQVFTWEILESVATGQKSYEIQYKKTTESSWTTVTGTSSNQYHSFAANTFDTASYDWKLRVTNNDENTSEYETASFIAIGATNAPNITNITNSAIPTITWQINSQDTFELEIYSDNDRLYSSGVQVGANIRSFTPNLMLKDGNYIVKMRSMNEYGYFTDWSDYSFVLNATKPSAVDCIAYANDCHGVNIMKNTGTAENMYVLKRKFGDTEWDIIGKLDTVFTDNTVISDHKYEYAIRNYKDNAGYADSNVVAMVIYYQGLIIYDGNEFVQLFKTEDEQFDISHTPSKSYAYSYTIGRKYPVRESSEWMSYTTSFSCFVDYDNYEKLEKFYESNDDLWFKSKDTSYKCSIDSLQISETLLGKGYTVTISLSRTDENEVDLLE